MPELPARPESDWKLLVSLRLSSRGAMIVDPMSWDEFHLELKGGIYEIFIRTVHYENEEEPRLSRVRVVRERGGVLAGVIGQVGSDAAIIGILDAVALSPERKKESDRYQDELESSWQSGELTGTVKWGDDDNAMMAHVTTGFGDGTYDVKEVIKADERVGFEVEFIRKNQPYPF